MTAVFDNEARPFGGGPEFPLLSRRPLHIAAAATAAGFLVAGWALLAGGRQ